MWTKAMSKSCKDKFGTKVVNKHCEQNLWTKFVKKICEPMLWTKVMNAKSCEHELCIRVINKTFEQKFKNFEQKLWTKLWTTVANKCFE